MTEHPRPLTASTLLAAALFAAVSTAAPLAAQAPADLAVGSRPNLVVVMTDDLDEGLLQKAIEAGFMPSFERHFSNGGARLTSSFVSNSLCCPSRATFLSGQYTHNHGVLTNSPPYGYPAFEDESTLATWLTDAGYATGFVGKYLNGYDATRDLDGDGEPDDFAYVPPGWTYWQGLIDNSTYRVYDYELLNGDTGERESYPDAYQTDLLRQKSLDFLDAMDESDDSTPFFLWITPLTPHVERGVGPPVCVTPTGRLDTIRAAPRHEGSAADIEVPRTPNFNEPDISDKPDWLQTAVPEPLSQDLIDCIDSVYRDKLEAMRAVDDLIGALGARLRRLGEDHTVLIFTSDNGFFHGEHRLTRKTYAYEEGIRVPLAVRYLGTANPRTIDQLVVNNDLAPTLAALAGAAVPASVDGRSLLPLFSETAPATWRRRVLVEHFEGDDGGLLPQYVAIRAAADGAAPPLAYVEYRAPDAAEPDGCLPGLCELYLLGGDPFERRSLDQEPPFAEAIADLEILAAAFMDCAGDGCRMLEDL